MAKQSREAWDKSCSSPFVIALSLGVMAGLCPATSQLLWAQAVESQDSDSTTEEEAEELERLLVITGADTEDEEDGEESLDRFYAAFNVGTMFLERSRIEVTDSIQGRQLYDWEPGAGWDVGGALGIRFGQMRADFEVNYSSASTGDSVNVGTTQRFSSDATMETYSGWANLYWDIPVRGKLKPFIGGGLGYALGIMNLDLGGLNYGEETDQAFGTQAMVGASYEIRKDLFLTAQYKHRFLDNFDFNAGTTSAEASYGSDSFTLGVRYFFGDSKPMAMPKTDLTMASAGLAAQPSSSEGAQMWPPQSAPGTPPGDSGFTEAPDQDQMGVSAAPIPTQPMSPPSSGNEMEALSRQMAALGQSIVRETERQAAVAPEPPSTGFQNIERGSLASGDWGVQLASYRNRKYANRGWRDANRRFASLLAGTEQRIVQVDVPGKGLFYRLYAGGLSKAEAKHICQALQRRGQWCSLGRLSR